MTKKKRDPKKTAVRILCLVLAVSMVATLLFSVIYYLLL